MNSTGFCFCKNLIEAAATYRPLRDYCAYKFKKQPVFYFQADENNPPAKADMPLVVFHNFAADDNEPTTTERVISIGCAIEDEDVDTSNDFAKGMYKVFETIEIFERHVFNAVKAYMDTRAEYGESILGNNGMAIKGFYPQFHAARTLNIVTQRET